MEFLADTFVFLPVSEAGALSEVTFFAGAFFGAALAVLGSLSVEPGVEPTSWRFRGGILCLVTGDSKIAELVGVSRFCDKIF